MLGRFTSSFSFSNIMFSAPLISFSKPISRSLSASSNIINLRLSKFKFPVFFKWYSNRPGVHIKTFIPFLNLDFS